MAYRKRGSSKRRSYSGTRNKGGYSRGYSRGSSSRRSTASRSRPREMVLRLEIAPQSPVSRPSYLAALNPAVIEKPRGTKAKL